MGRVMDIAEIGRVYGGTSWGDAAYKKATDEESGRKVDMGNGCKVHPSKKARFKLQSESDPDVAKTVGSGEFGSRRAAVKVIRRQGSDYLPVIEDSLKVISTEPEDLEELPELPTYTLRGDGVQAMYGSDYYRKLKEFEETPEYKQVQQARREARARNDARREEYIQQTRRGVISEDTPAFAYKRFKLEAAGLVEDAKRNDENPKRFYLEHAFELQAHAMNAAEKCGVNIDQLRGFIHEAGHTELARVIEDPSTYRDEQKAAKRDKPKTARKGRTKRVKASEMSMAELESARKERLEAYMEIVNELNRRNSVNAAPENDPDPDGGEPVTTTPVDTTEAVAEIPEVDPAPLTKAEKKAIMRDRKRKRNAHRRKTRRMLAREGKGAA